MTRLAYYAVPVALLLTVLRTGDAVAAPAPGERWAAVGPVVGYRTFASPLELDDEFAIGARISLGLSDRLTVMIDGAHADPTRRTSGVVSSFGDIRALFAYRLRTTGLCPFLLAGIGGQVLNFHDAPATASAVVPIGIGADILLSPEWMAILEVSADIYRGRLVRYSSTGTELSSTPRETYATGILSVGFLYRF